MSAYEPNEEEIGYHMMKHGDGVHDVSFAVEDLDNIMKHAKSKGAKVIRDIWEESDANGKVRMATIKTVCKQYCTKHYTF